MEVKSASDCFNILDFAIVKNKIGSSDLENIHKYLLQKGESNFIEDRLALSNVLRQMNSIIENRYQNADVDIKSEYVQLRKLILFWLIASSTEPEVEDQQ